MLRCPAKMPSSTTTDWPAASYITGASEVRVTGYHTRGFNDDLARKARMMSGIAWTRFRASAGRSGPRPCRHNPIVKPDQKACHSLFRQRADDGMGDNGLSGPGSPAYPDHHRRILFSSIAGRRQRSPPQGARYPISKSTASETVSNMRSGTGTGRSLVGSARDFGNRVLCERRGPNFKLPRRANVTQAVADDNRPSLCRLAVRRRPSVKQKRARFTTFTMDFQLANFTWKAGLR